jgi:predicted DNA-binding transcriptional regulator AlpA
MDRLIPINELAEEIAERLRQAIPLSIALWDMSTIAAYLKVTQRHVGERIVCLPSFPKAIRLPSAKGNSHPRWKAAEVIDWVEKYQK